MISYFDCIDNSYLSSLSLNSHGIEEKEVFTRIFGQLKYKRLTLKMINLLCCDYFAGNYFVDLYFIKSSDYVLNDDLNFGFIARGITQNNSLMNIVFHVTSEENGYKYFLYNMAKNYCSQMTSGINKENIFPVLGVFVNRYYSDCNVNQRLELKKDKGSCKQLHNNEFMVISYDLASVAFSNNINKKNLWLYLINNVNCLKMIVAKGKINLYNIKSTLYNYYKNHTE